MVRLDALAFLSYSEVLLKPFLTHLGEDPKMRSQNKELKFTSVSKQMHTLRKA